LTSKKKEEKEVSAVSLSLPLPLILRTLLGFCNCCKRAAHDLCVSFATMLEWCCTNNPFLSC
jgi:hypothetical protein